MTKIEIGSNADLAQTLSSGTEAFWNRYSVPIPKNVVIYCLDTKIFKVGTGRHLFKELPISENEGGVLKGSWQDIWFDKVKYNQCIVCRSEPEEGKFCERYDADIKKGFGRCRNFN